MAPENMYCSAAERRKGGPYQVWDLLSDVDGVADNDPETGTKGVVLKYPTPGQGVWGRGAIGGWGVAYLIHPGSH